jgi:hypothetical protein
MRRCRYCVQEIPDAATVCPHCSRDLIPGRHTTPAMVTPTSSAPLATVKTCPFCAEEIQAAAIVCKHCRKDLPEAVKPLATVKTPLIVTDKRHRMASLLLLSAGVVVTMIAFAINNNAALLTVATLAIGIGVTVGLAGRPGVRIAIGIFAAILYGMVAPVFMPLTSTAVKASFGTPGEHHPSNEGCARIGAKMILYARDADSAHPNPNSADNYAVWKQAWIRDKCTKQ